MISPRQLIFTRRYIESCDSNKENINNHKKTTTTTNNTNSTTNSVSSATSPTQTVHQQMQQPQTQTQQQTVVTSVNICLFPDAPTTPKVVRKSPSTETSPTSVKALVKKFQLECNETTCNGSSNHNTSSVLLKDTQNQNNKTKVVNGHGTSSTDTVDSSASSNATPTTSATTNNSTATPSTYKTTCVFCLSCGGPGCRHSGTAMCTTKSTSVVVAPPGMDQGIIC